MERILESIRDVGGVSIVTHNDPDGILAAAICCRALASKGVGARDVDMYFESPSTVQKNASRFLDPDGEDFVGGFIILLDLPYNENADIWIDHHESETDIVPNEATLAVVQDTTRSAAMLANEFFLDLVGTSTLLCDPRFLEFVDARDTGGPVGDIPEAFETLSLAIHEDRNDYAFFEELVRTLAKSDDVAKIVQEGKVILKAKNERRKVNRGIKHLENTFASDDFDTFMSAIDRESSKIAGDETKLRSFLVQDLLLFLDFSDFDNSEKEKKQGISVPYYIIDEILKRIGHSYSFLLVFRGDDKTGDIHCTIGINQSEEKDIATNDVDISQLAKDLGGGGHDYAAGFVIPPEKFLETIERVAIFVNVHIG
jgi:nanoRNase/pAp phosphatase (c-di-AMP/oligoRNAs hydrolase)